MHNYFAKLIRRLAIESRARTRRILKTTAVQGGIHSSSVPLAILQSDRQQEVGQRWRGSGVRSRGGVSAVSCTTSPSTHPTLGRPPPAPSPREPWRTSGVKQPRTHTHSSSLSRPPSLPLFPPLPFSSLLNDLALGTDDEDSLRREPFLPFLNKRGSGPALPSGDCSFIFLLLLHFKDAPPASIHPSPGTLSSFYVFDQDRRVITRVQRREVFLFPRETILKSLLWAFISVYWYFASLRFFSPSISRFVSLWSKPDIYVGYPSCLLRED